MFFGRPKQFHSYRFLKKQFFHLTPTNYNLVLSSYEIRKRFLDYFINEKSHRFVRSSPVAPLHDKSLAFVNAGMNQFKDVFLNKTVAPSLTVANSQKCIRIGGKHNDLKSVGLDSYHHTFFEMLGNWSFGKYFKKEACELAYTLLTTPPYSIDPKRLYVTYFSGCNHLKLGPDLETKEIWRSLGISPDHILGFGVKDNFWEMGRTGPCGPCTEIHVDLFGSRDASFRVNAGYSDVKELWNIVFIQYNRSEDGTLSNLPIHHVDTGMGFERLVALLQNKESNYDTDLFTPLFNVISKVSKASLYKGKFGNDAPLDSAYRILADHGRMITVALADNMFPDHNHKLRRILRKALLVAEDTFKMKNSAKLLKEVSNGVAEVLSTTYPEVGAKLNKVHLVIDHEWEVLKALRTETSTTWRSLVEQDPRLRQLSSVYAPGLIPAYKELRTVKQVSGEMAFHLYDTHGLQSDLIEELCHALGLDFDENEFDDKLAEVKEKRLGNIVTNTSIALSPAALTKLKTSVPVTDVSAKYEYRRIKKVDNKVEYLFPEVRAVIQAVIKQGDIVERSEGREGEKLGVLLDRTPLYSEAGGQQADSGLVMGEGWVLDCEAVYDVGGYQLHFGTLKTSSSELCPVLPGAQVSVRVDEERRLANMRNHTATHCLNAVLHHLFTATHQTGSFVTQTQLTFQFAIYGQPITKQRLSEVEDGVLNMVRSSVPVTRTTVSSDQLLDINDVTLLPGETYPSNNIHLIQIQHSQFNSKEACCGTHVMNTGDIEDFCVCAVQSAGSGGKAVTAVTGQAARDAKLTGQQALEQVTFLQKQIQTSPPHNIQLQEELAVQLQTTKKRILEELMPYRDQVKSLELLESSAKLLKNSARDLLRLTMEEEMKQVLQQTVISDVNCRFLVHSLRTTSQLDKIPLEKVTKMCPLHLPVIIFAYAENQLKARCCVPQAKVSHKANAEAWMAPVLKALAASGGAPRGQDPRLVFNMKPLRVSPTNAQELITKAVDVANKHANKLFD